MRLRDYRQAVSDSIAAAVTDLRDVKPHPGRFTLEELQRYSVKSPAARVTFVGMKNVGSENAGRMIGPAAMAVFIICNGTDHDGQLLDLMEQVADVIQFNHWGLADISAAIVDRVENLSSSATGMEGVSIGAVTFEQQIAFGTNRYEADAVAEASWLNDLTTLGDVLAVTGDQPPVSAAGG